MRYWQHTSNVATVEPSIEPVSVQAAKNYARIDTDADDDVIRALITAVRQQIERTANRALITQTRRVQLDSWPKDDVGIVRLPFAPLQSVSWVQYYDQTGTLTTWAASNYNVDTDSTPGTVERKDGIVWPSVEFRGSPIRISYVCGYGASEDSIPQPLRVAIMAGVLDLYEHRETNAEYAVKENRAVANLIRPYMVMAT